MLLLLTHLKSKYTVSTRVQTAFTTSVRAPCKHTARVSLYCSGVCAVHSHTNTNHHGHFYVCAHTCTGERNLQLKSNQAEEQKKERKKEKGKEGEKKPQLRRNGRPRGGEAEDDGGHKEPMWGCAPCGIFGPMSAGWDSPVWCFAATDFGNLRPLPSRKEVEQPKPPLNHPECKIKGKIK